MTYSLRLTWIDGSVTYSCAHATKREAIDHYWRIIDMQELANAVIEHR